jgi:hypothetical protein
VQQSCTRVNEADWGRSYSRLLAFEASRVLFRLGCDVRVYDPTGLPVKDDVQHSHPKVQELRDLSKWSDGHVWISPEQHGNLVSALEFFSRYALRLANAFSLHRLQCSKIRSTGSPFQQVQFDQLRDAPWR